MTSGQSVLSVGQTNSMIPDCRHEEADMRVAVHILHALKQGIKSIVIQTVNTCTDVIVTFELIANKPLDDT